MDGEPDCGRGSPGCWTRDRRPVRALLPEAADLDVEVFALPNLGGVNVLVHGLLGEGVAASAPGSTRRPRRSASGCGRGTSTSRRRCCERLLDATEQARA